MTVKEIVTSVTGVSLTVQYTIVHEYKKQYKILSIKATDGSFMEFVDVTPITIKEKIKREIRKLIS